MSGREIRLEDARQVFRLLNDASDLGAGETAQQHLLDGICRILHTRVATAGLVIGLDRGAFELTCDHCVGVSETEAAVLFSPYAALGKDGDPLLGRMLSTSPVSGVRVHSRRELLSDAEWYGDALVADVRISMFLDDTIHAYRACGRGAVVGLQIVRDAADGSFDDRDRNLVELIMLEAERGLIPQAAAQSRPVMRDERPRSEHLTPREEQTLECLLNGSSEKEVAAQLGISFHTVHQHVKRLYRAFNVASRGELMARVLRSR
jgi:DNA-binding CsgD family transcriptional regulator